AKDQWKAGHARIRIFGEFFFAIFDWDQAAQSGLIEARRVDAATLAGRYVNLGNRAIVRPWVGTVVDARRIDGQWTGGRLDFRR
ncbi:MAG TPA: hypothetical protein VFX09_04870, partial [Burkholderiales bacterium]|nr:hypothetical protein [Burkholderiales bacterium]